MTEEGSLKIKDVKKQVTRTMKALGEIFTQSNEMVRIGQENCELEMKRS